MLELFLSTKRICKNVETKYQVYETNKEAVGPTM